jgi:hypothetical protein
LKKKTGSLNSKIFSMEKDLTKEKDEAAPEEIVIPDECGDTMWDAVLKEGTSPNPSKGGALEPAN